MRGPDTQQSAMFSYLSPEQRVPADHPLRQIRVMVDQALKALSPALGQMYAAFGRPPIAPEKLLRALLLQVLYTVRSERMLMDQLEYNLLFRWFAGLNMDEAVWVATVFSKNRDRLMEGDIAQKFFDQVLTSATRKRACVPRRSNDWKASSRPSGQIFRLARRISPGNRFRISYPPALKPSRRERFRRK